jgi:hypothetical protein
MLDTHEFLNWNILSLCPSSGESWAGWIMFLCLQLGRDRVPRDDILFRKMMSALKTEYGFRHQDRLGREEHVRATDCDGS